MKIEINYDEGKHEDVTLSELNLDIVIREILILRVVGSIWSFRFKDCVYFPSRGNFGDIIIM